jgi:hypothetical protein
MYEADEDKAKEYYRSLDLTIRGVDNDVKIIKNWMKSQPHLPEIMGESMPFLAPKEKFNLMKSL